MSNRTGLRLPRSSPSAHRSPLTRHPLGDRCLVGLVAFIGVVAVADAVGANHVGLTPTPVSASLTPIPEAWQTYANRDIGIVLRYPPKMTVRTGSAAKVEWFFEQPQPDLQITISDEQAQVEASVVARADAPDYCKNYSEADAEVLAGRSFVHWKVSDGGNRVSIGWECFCTRYRGRDFWIAAVTTTWTFADDPPSVGWDVIERRRSEIAAQALQVLHTLALTGP
jgi:hypothetical protein